MNETQYYVLVAIPLVGIMLNGGLYLYLASRLDKLIDIVSGMNSRIAVLEDRRVQ